MTLCEHGRKNRECVNCFDIYQKERADRNIPPGPFGIFCEHRNRKSSCRTCFDMYQKKREEMGQPPAPFGIFCKHGVNYQTKYKCSHPDCVRTSKKPISQLTPQSRPTPRPRPTTFKPYIHKIKMCKHNIRLNRCKECGGIDLCIHGVQKYFCKTCMGAGVCKEHGVDGKPPQLISRCKSCIARKAAAHADSAAAAAVQFPWGVSAVSTQHQQDFEFGAAAQEVAGDPEMFPFHDLGKFRADDDDDGWHDDDGVVTDDEDFFGDDVVRAGHGDGMDDQDGWHDGMDDENFSGDDVVRAGHGYSGGEKKSRKFYKRSNKKTRKTKKSKPYRKTHKKIKRKSKRSSRLTVKI